MSAAAPPPRLGLGSELKYLKGAGPQAGACLRALGLHRVQDLLFHLPLRYEDRRRITALNALREGEETVVRGRVAASDSRFAPRRSLRVAIDDGSASLLLRFFHFNEGQRAAFVNGVWVQAFGTPRMGRNGWEMVHPEYRTAPAPESFTLDERLTPIYPLTTGMTQARLRKLIAQALELAENDPHLRAQLPGLNEPETLAALKAIHHPQSDADTAALLARRHPAQQRLIREELLSHQLCMRLLRRDSRSCAAAPITGVATAASELNARLPFRFTGAQSRVIGEIAQDMAQPRPMLRLVQGDVGSGKTVVAAVAMLAAARAGLQAALMAPTELLVEQHHANLRTWFAPLGLDVERLSARGSKSARAQRLARVAAGEVPLVVGTHAMFQEQVRFQKLGLAVIDEQHRFGVQQRLALRDKGAVARAPHQLVMSATPIPRTLAQTLYADLDVSVINELPPGRSPITTVVLGNGKRDEVLARIGAACRQNRQAYWVCTLIEDSEDIEAQAAEATLERLRQELPDLKVGLIHGRLKAEDKDSQMKAFQAGELHVLVATTVIEVGVDVPQASIMVIENAERLGLAQLHQLRGRVGRGSTASLCLLMYQAPLSQHARARLETMRETQDGFRIAERDLELRGPGELLGRRQTGVVGLKLADPARDAALIPPLQTLADEWLERYPLDAGRLIARWMGEMEKYGKV